MTEPFLRLGAEVAICDRRNRVPDEAAAHRMADTGGMFYAIRDWSDEMWRQARERIGSQNAKVRARR